VTVYTFSEARQRFAFVLERARREDVVPIRGGDGQAFLIQPKRQAGSPLDVPALDAGISAEEIVATVRETRRPVKALGLSVKGSQGKRRKRSAASRGCSP
jgi:antitoxin Phd